MFNEEQSLYSSYNKDTPREALAKVKKVAHLFERVGKNGGKKH